MEFNSLIFLFLFLPLLLLIYFILNPGIRNIYLIMASLFFYAWGQKEAVFILIFLIIINYFFSKWISGAKNNRSSRRIFITALIFNILVLIFYKYLTFLLSVFGIEFKLEGIPFPTGISFLTFIAISYLTDIYRKSVPFIKGLTHYALYTSLFPKLITGPITIYSSFKDQLNSREISVDDLSWGIKKFVTGLGKKVLLADIFAVTADRIFTIPAEKLNSPLSWIGVIAYSLQIYYDFSGYSDMAIGLGRMLGFRIPENFKYPYSAESIKDFWDRWHITLGQWLKKYLFLPIAFSVMRMTAKDKILKIKIENWAYLAGIIFTFTLCGFWHGANWTFILWGAYYGLLLGIEHIRVRKFLKKRSPYIFRVILTQFFVMIGWVVFRSPDIEYSLTYIGSMLGSGNSGELVIGTEYLLNSEFLFTGFIGIVFALPFVPLVKQRLSRFYENFEKSSLKSKKIFRILELSLENLLYTGVVILSVMAISAGTYKPFIYFRF